MKPGEMHITSVKIRSRLGLSEPETATPGGKRAAAAFDFPIRYDLRVYEDGVPNSVPR